MAELWQDATFRQFAIGFLAMVIISVAKKYSDYANTNSAFKYCAVLFLAVIGALFTQLSQSPTVDFGQLSGDVVKIAAAAIFGYNTVGAAAKSILDAYTKKKEGQ